MLEHGLVAQDRLLELYEAVEDELYRYPAVNPATLRNAVEAVAQPGNGPPPGAR